MKHSEFSFPPRKHKRIDMLLIPGFFLAAALLSTPSVFSADTKGVDSVCELTIVGDEVDSNEKTLFYFAKGHAVASIKGQDSKLEADTIRYSDLDKIIDARGGVRLTRNKMISKYSDARFKIGSSQFLVTQPGSRVVGLKLISRKRDQD